MIDLIKENTEEFKLFLELIKKTPKDKFAVIKISGECLENEMDIIAKDIAYLNSLNIYPIIIHGAGTTINKQLPNSKNKNGIRITSNEDILVIKNISNDISYNLVNKINQFGGSANKINNIFTCKQKKEYGNVGEIIDINISKIEESISNNITPVINSIGTGKNKLLLNINADTAAKEIVKNINPKKFILITSTGGILDSNKNIIPFINLSDDYTSLVTDGMLLKLNELKDFSNNNSSTDIVITSPKNLIEEIFTIKGKGTIIKNHILKSSKNINELDKEKIKDLLENAFGKKLKENYFKTGSFCEIIYQKDYEGIAIIKDLNGLKQIDKFAVAKHAQGNGLGKCIWKEINKKHEKLIWRALVNNPLNQFYYKNSSGNIKINEWSIFWNNLLLSEIPNEINNIINQEKSFKENKL